MKNTNATQAIKAAALLAAIQYVAAPEHADWYLFPVTVAHGAGTHGSKRELQIAKVARETLLDRLQTEKALQTGWLKIHENVLKVAKISETALRKTFGSQVTFHPLDQFFSTYNDLPLDQTPCAGPRARTFEKLACKVFHAIWCGALNRVQVDGVVRFVDEAGNVVKVRYEVKGLMGRLVAFVPSAIDKDGRE